LEGKGRKKREKGGKGNICEVLDDREGPPRKGAGLRTSLDRKGRKRESQKNFPPNWLGQRVG